jgi:hypothetical protein
LAVENGGDKFKTCFGAESNPSADGADVWGEGKKKQGGDSGFVRSPWGVEAFSEM